MIQLSIQKIPKNLPKKFGKFAGHKVNTEKQIVFLYTRNGELEIKIKNQYHFQQHPKHDILRDKPNKICWIHMLKTAAH